MTRPFALALTALLTLPGAALAQSDHSQMGHSSGQETAAGVDEARSAFEAANARMHGAMDIEPTGDADIDFARAMIPHHRGAIDMATIVLEHGEAPELRALAQEIIAAQEAEIGRLEAWLAQNDSAAAPAQ